VKILVKILSPEKPMLIFKKNELERKLEKKSRSIKKKEKYCLIFHHPCIIPKLELDISQKDC
jgi:hypothetical protein